ncbi:MAG: hypothetical protein JXA17_07150 [Dehalococcoidales bacterium]|nr:hypothetical protein [Dehalococcoidales bacterium]
MKKLITIILCFILPVLVFTSCSAVTGGQSEINDVELYKEAIYRYYDAIFDTDVEALLNSMDPSGPIYPDDEAIQNLYASSVGEYTGEVIIEDIFIVEESDTRALLDITLFSSVDYNNQGDFWEKTSYLTIELSFFNDLWRIFNVNNESPD